MTHGAPDDHGATTVLVDTSLLIEQQKHPKSSEPVRKALSKYRFRGASSYSRVEFKRAWMRNAAYLMRTCEEAEAEDVTDVIRSITNRLGGNPHQSRRLNTLIEMINAFLGKDDSQFRSKAALAKLRTYCRNIILSGWEQYTRLVTGEFRGTGCVRATEPVAVDRLSSPSVTIRRCSPTKKQCLIDDFFIANRACFARIADHVKAMPECSGELTRAKDTIISALRDPTTLLNDANCSKLADCIIAVDGISMDVFAAHNDREWPSLAELFGKPLLNPVRGTNSGDQPPVSSQGL